MRLIQADLTRAPTAAAANQIGWDDVQVMMATRALTATMGGTTLGPRWPELRLVGAIYLERDFARALLAASACLPVGRDERAPQRIRLARMCGGLAAVDQVLPRHDALGRGHNILGGEGAAQGPQPVEDA